MPQFVVFPSRLNRSVITSSDSILSMGIFNIIRFPAGKKFDSIYKVWDFVEKGVEKVEIIYHMVLLEDWLFCISYI